MGTANVGSTSMLPASSAADRPAWLPKGVYAHNGRYRKSVRIDGRQRWVSLSRVEDGRIGLERALRELASSSQPEAGIPQTVRDLVYWYLEAQERLVRQGSVDALAPKTLSGYWALADRSPLIESFGRARPADLQQSDIVRYLRARREAGAPIAGNRERALLSSAFSFAIQNEWTDANPCLQVPRNHERPKSKYVGDAEFEAALAKVPRHIADVLEFAYLTGLRKGDILRLRRSDLHDAGIVCVEGKTSRSTGKTVVIRWSKALRACIKRALARQTAVATKPADERLHRQARPESDFIFTNSRNQPLTAPALDSALKRLGDLKSFSMHDIRAKAATDDASKKPSNNILGHTSQMRAVYTRRRIVNPVK